MRRPPPTRAMARPNDGRLVRRHRNHIDMVAATRALMRAGFFRPTAHQIIAEVHRDTGRRVSLRTLSDHFRGGVEALLREAMRDVELDIAHQVLLDEEGVPPAVQRRIARAAVLGRVTT